MMNVSLTGRSPRNAPPPRGSGPAAAAGFTLVITVLLMVLLSMVAVGLLSLSSISLRNTSRGSEIQQAQANARLALSLAIAQLQAAAGPDQRITAPANLVHEQAPAGLTGVWESWRPPAAGGNYDAEKASRFVGYLMSQPDPLADPAPDRIPAAEESEVLVGEGSLGADRLDQQIAAPVLNVPNGALAWVALDEGVKARLDLAPEEESSGVGPLVTQVGSPARNHFSQEPSLAFLEGQDKQELRDRLPKLISLHSAALAAQAAGASAAADEGWGSDFTVSSQSLQSNVVDGGWKTDLSVLFENDLPSEYSKRYLYSEETTPISNGTGEPLWDLYANYAQLYRRTGPGNNAEDGFTASIPSGYKTRQVHDSALGQSVTEPDMSTVTEPVLMPTLLKTEIVFSVATRPLHGKWVSLQNKGFQYLVHLMFLPVVTLHNPYNVPLRFQELEVEFANIPVGFQFQIQGQRVTNGLIPFHRMYQSNFGNNGKQFKFRLTQDVSGGGEVVMGAGETRIFGRPFDPDTSWGGDISGSSRVMFDMNNDLTNGARNLASGLLTTPEYGVGFDIDYLAPYDHTTTFDSNRHTSGTIPVAGNEAIRVAYAPLPALVGNSEMSTFSVTLGMKQGAGSQVVSSTQVFFKDESRLTSILSEGTSLRFDNDERNFPELYPKARVDPTFQAVSILEQDSTPVSAYENARPFALFSLSAKTTQESFTAGRPVADTGITMQGGVNDFVTQESQGATPYEFIFTPVRSGYTSFENEGDKGFFFGGHGAARGSTRAVFYEIPFAPLQSLAQLRHANGASLGAAPFFTYSIGESRAHPALPAETAKFSSRGRVLLDHSWLANDTLWDHYWFSSLSSLEGPGYDGPSSVSQQELAERFFAGDRRLPNARNAAYLAAGTPPSSAAVASLEADGKNSASHILTRGGFNVNSTSVAAWTAVLSSLAHTEIPLVDGTTEPSGEESAFPRVRRPYLGAESGGVGANEALWNRFRTLTPAQTKALAERIVQEIKDRGPFLSMSEFVNRRLEDGTAYARSGVLQAAIDQAGINTEIAANGLEVTPSEVEDYDWANPEAVQGHSTAGSPGEISQGDVLSAIGSFLYVRSDTFRIRAYGDARDTQGKIVAQAWAEAVVQRFPEYVDAANIPEIRPADGTFRQANRLFGRRFGIVSFRWLDLAEI